MLSKKFFAGLLAINLTICTAIVSLIGPLGSEACALSFEMGGIPSLPVNIDEIQIRNHAILNPTVRVQAQGGSRGSATAIAVATKEGNKVVFVTNHHVVEANFPKPCGEAKKTKCEPPKGPAPVTLRGWITKEGTTYPVIYTAKIIADDPVNDLTIMETDTPWAGPIAKIVPPTVTVTPGETVWVSGAALGDRVHITVGLVSLTDVNIENQNYYLVSAPIMPGNSGGGLWLSRGGAYYLTGVPVSVGVSRGNMMTSHGYVIPMARVAETLAKLGMALMTPST